AVINHRWLSAAVKRVLGFARDRSLPEVGSTTLRQWIRKQQPTGKQGIPKRQIYLFCDEFTDYNDVGIGQTAYRLLTVLGYEVKLARHLESGRTYLSKGLLRKAKAIANQN